MPSVYYSSYEFHAQFNDEDRIAFSVLPARDLPVPCGVLLIRILTTSQTIVVPTDTLRANEAVECGRDGFRAFARNNVGPKSNVACGAPPIKRGKLAIWQLGQPNIFLPIEQFG